MLSNLTEINYSRLENENLRISGYIIFCHHWVIFKADKRKDQNSARQGYISSQSSFYWQKNEKSHAEALFDKKTISTPNITIHNSNTLQLLLLSTVRRDIFNPGIKIRRWLFSRKSLVFNYPSFSTNNFIHFIKLRNYVRFSFSSTRSLLVV